MHVDKCNENKSNINNFHYILYIPVTYVPMYKLFNISASFMMNTETYSVSD